MLSITLRRMTRPSPSALPRAKLIAQHMRMSTTATEPTVLFESNAAVRRYILNRPKKLNALDESMITALRPKIQEWQDSELCRIVVGDGRGKGFCAGGDVETVIRNAANEKTLHKSINYFKQEFELDHELATLQKPYVCILDGYTMGGGVGLSAHAPFRIATENTIFAMPETKIGYCPDVGASYFLPKLDGELGTYLGLTSEFVKGRAVFENGLATHFVPSRRIPQLLALLAELEEPTMARINAAIEDHYGEPLAEEASNPYSGELRVALDTAFGHNSIEEIMESLRDMEQSRQGLVGDWAKKTLLTLEQRSPTSLKVALRAVRLGKNLTLANALRMEMGIATSFLTGVSSDFATGVTKVLVEKERDNRPPWSPASVEEVSKELVEKFFAVPDDAVPKLELQEALGEKAHNVRPMEFGLPTEEEVKQVVRGEHPQSGAVALTLGEVIQKFRSMTSGKHGVEAKIRDIAARRCEEVADPDNHHCLQWK